MSELRQVVHLDDEQFTELVNKGTITVGDITVEYIEGLYLAPDDTDERLTALEKAVKKYRHRITINHNGVPNTPFNEDGSIFLEVILSTPDPITSLQDERLYDEVGIMQDYLVRGQWNTADGSSKYGLALLTIYPTFIALDKFDVDIVESGATITDTAHIVDDTVKEI